MSLSALLCDQLWPIQQWRCEEIECFASWTMFLNALQTGQSPDKETCPLSKLPPPSCLSSEIFVKGQLENRSVVEVSSECVNGKHEVTSSPVEAKSLTVESKRLSPVEAKYSTVKSQSLSPEEAQQSTIEFTQLFCSQNELDFFVIVITFLKSLLP